MRADHISRYYALGADERRVIDHALEELLTGLEVGRERYGELLLATDQRDFAREARAELRDGLIYLAAEAVRRQQ